MGDLSHKWAANRPDDLSFMLSTCTPGANFTYLAPIGQFFVGAKSFIETPEMQIIVVLKDKTQLHYENIHGFHGNRCDSLAWGCTYKIDHISVVTNPRILKLVLFQSLDITIWSCGE